MSLCILFHTIEQPLSKCADLASFAAMQLCPGLNSKITWQPQSYLITDFHMFLLRNIQQPLLLDTVRQRLEAEFGASRC